MRILIQPKYRFLNNYIEQIPQEFEKEPGEVLYEARNLLRRVKVNDIEMVIKSFHQPVFLNRIIYSFFRKSKALRSYEYSTYLNQNGISAPDPIACIIETKGHLINRSFYVNRYEDIDTVREVMDGSLAGNEKLLDAFARFMVKVHEKGILHRDLSPGNILYKQTEAGDYDFYLIDVNRMKLHVDINMDTACRNFRRLCTSKEVLRYIAQQYATYRNWDVTQMVHLSETVSDRFFRKFFYHRAATRSKAKHIRLLILQFRMLRYLRAHRIPSSNVLFKREREIYGTFLKDYDFRRLYQEEYACATKP